MFGELKLIALKDVTLKTTLALKLSLILLIQVALLPYAQANSCSTASPVIYANLGPLEKIRYLDELCPITTLQLHSKTKRPRYKKDNGLLDNPADPDSSNEATLLANLKRFSTFAVDGAHQLSTEIKQDINDNNFRAATSKMGQFKSYIEILESRTTQLQA